MARKKNHKNLRATLLKTARNNTVSVQESSVCHFIKDLLRYTISLDMATQIITMAPRAHLCGLGGKERNRTPVVLQRHEASTNLEVMPGMA